MLIKHLTESNYDKLSLSELVKIIRRLNKKYYEDGISLVTDQLYDLLKDKLKMLDPSNELLSQIDHSDINKSKHVKLPHYLGSMDKIYPKDVREFTRFCNTYKGPYILSHKLDGISALISNGKAFTRGPNGVHGTPITAKLNEIMPELIQYSLEHSVSIRGELVISRDDFSHIQEEEKGDISNARNLVAGIINAKTRRKYVEYIQFVAYELINPGGVNDPQSDQFQILDEIMGDFRGCKVVPYISGHKRVSVEELSEIFQSWRHSSPYFIDGVIVTSDHPYERNRSGNPPYQFAFKMILEDQMVSNVTVLDIEYNVSKDGLLKPVLIIEPTMINNVKIERVTAYNAAYVRDHCLGRGAEITLIRSGDVIPKVVEVTRRASRPLYPPSSSMSYHWNDTNIDLVLDERNDDQAIKEIAYFFESAGVRNVGESTVRTLYLNGYDTLLKILSMDEDVVNRVKGFGKAKYRYIADLDLKHLKLSQVMKGSCCFGRGFGERKLTMIVNSIPIEKFGNNFKNHLSMEDKNELRGELIEISSLGDITVDNFLEGINDFIDFLHTHRKYIGWVTTTPPEAADSGTKLLQGEIIVMSGFRDANLRAMIESLGGKVTDSVSKKTTKLLIPSMESLESGGNKIKKAQELGIEIIPKDIFYNTLL